MNSEAPTLAYWKIRGLGAPIRMMMYYKGQKFTLKSYGEDSSQEYFATDKPLLAEKHPLINLPYLVDGDVVVTQSNTTGLYVGKMLGIDSDEFWVKNHTVLDQTYDLRNDVIGLVYPSIKGVTLEKFPEALEKHMNGSAKNHFSKLEKYCTGPYMCGAKPQTCDFFLFEILDQQIIMCKETNVAFPFEEYPKLMAMHAAMKAEPALAAYFAADIYTKYPMNNPMAKTNFAGSGFDGNFGPTVTEVISM
ncbi:hypothetical protein AB1Y20_009985 [Prymnesium parvum]|uniref:glutathione transferase n=1 Tax=Prymnesium parvum TaxID=97485 RepID=A0AB34K642_PRYPA